jgi:hypothetical protein
MDATAVRLLASRVLESESDPAILHEVIVGLRGLPPGEARDPLLAAYDASEDPHRLRLSRTLALMAGDRVRDRLVALAGSGSAAERTVAVSGLAGRGGAEVGRVLVEALGDAVWEVRAAAIDALAARDDPATVGALVGALEREGPGRLREDLVAVLRKISGAGIGADAAQWKRWLEAHPSGRAPALVAEGRAPSVGIRLGAPTGRTVYVLDLSRSMGEPIEISMRLRRDLTRGGFLDDRDPLRRIDLAMALLRRSLSRLERGARFDVVILTGKPWTVRGHLVPAEPREVRRVLSRIGHLSPSGPTDIAGALRRALEVGLEGRPERRGATGTERIVLVSEGFPSGGEPRDRAAIVSRVRETFLMRRVRVDTVGVGPCDVDLLAELAHVTGGRFARVGE